MKSKSANLFIVILTMLIILIYLAQMVYNYRHNHFSCGGNITFSDDKRSYSVQVKYIFNGGGGKVIARGEYHEAGMKNVRLLHQLAFDYMRRDDSIVMFSTTPALSDTQARMLDTLVPDFYLYKDRGFRVRIFKQGKSGYIFTNLGIPVFICTKI
ncbi:hypothetical protein ACMYSN_17950 [Klebsiella sp. R445]